MLHDHLAFFYLIIYVFLPHKIFYKMVVKNDESVSNLTDDFQDSFITSIVHDLKNLMVPIVSRSELLMLPNLTEEKRQKMIKQLNASCNTLLDALNKMVSICKNRTNKGDYNFETFSLLPLVTEILDLLEENIEIKSINVKTHISPEILVFADRESIMSVITNLVGNAVKFTPNKGNVDIIAEESDTEVLIRVCDSGVGIDESRISDLLKNNHYYTTPGTNGESGTGLGLMLCEAQLLRNHSNLQFSNRPSGGSEFAFKLPRR